MYAMALSATSHVQYSPTGQTPMPRFVASSRSTWSNPVEFSEPTLSFGARSIASASTVTNAVSNASASATCS